MKIVLNKKVLQIEENTIRAFHERQDEEHLKLVGEFLRDPDGKQPWTVVPSARLIKIWRDRVKHGFVRDSKGIAEIADRMIANTIRLWANTVLCGHTQLEPADLFDLCTDEDWEEYTEQFGDYCQDKHGQWRISDYALDKLMDDALELYAERDDSMRLLIIDRMLQRAHARGDLADSFVEGGSMTLTTLKEQ